MKRGRIPPREFLIALTAVLLIASLSYVGLQESLGSVDPKSGLRHGTMRMLLTDTMLMQCEITEKSDHVDIRGTVYSGNGMLRADLESTVKTATAGRVIRQHMILNDRHYFAWSDDALSGEGITSSRQSRLSDTKRGSDEPFFPLTLDQMIFLHCATWNFEKMKFVAPININFQDAANLVRNSSEQQIPPGEGTAGVNYGVLNPFVSP